MAQVRGDRKNRNNLQKKLDFNKMLNSRTLIATPQNYGVQAVAPRGSPYGGVLTLLF